MKWTERILVLLVALGAILKFTLISGGSVLFLFSLLALITIYFYFSFLLFNGIRFRHIFKKHAYKGISGLRLAFVILSGFSLSVLLTGVVFKLMYWPGAGVNLLLGMSACLIVLVLAIIKYFGKKENFYRGIIFRFTPCFVIGFLLYSVNRQSLVNFQYRNHPQFAKAFIEREEDPSNEEKNKKVEVERDRMHMSPEEFKQYHPEEK